MLLSSIFFYSRHGEAVDRTLLKSLLRMLADLQVINNLQLCVCCICTVEKFCLISTRKIVIIVHKVEGFCTVHVHVDQYNKGYIWRNMNK